MTTSAARKAVSATAARNGGPGRSSGADPVVVYAASSLDGTSFALDPESQRRVRSAFPDVHVSTRHIFIAHDTREAFGESIGRFEDQIAILLTGISPDRLTERFSFVSFRDPKSERELGRLPARAARRA